MEREEALNLCERGRKEKHFGLLGRAQCWGCVKYSKGDPQKMCMYNEETDKYDACPLINKLKQKLSPAH